MVTGRHAGSIIGIPSPKTSPTVVDHASWRSSTGTAMSVAVIALVSEPRWNLSSIVTRSLPPACRIPTALEGDDRAIAQAANTVTPPSRTAIPRWMGRRTSRSGENGRQGAFEPLAATRFTRSTTRDCQPS